MSGDRMLLRVAQTACAAMLVVGFALPFLRIGLVSRSAFELLRSANRLRVIDGAPAVGAAVLIATTPMLAALLLALTGASGRAPRTVRAVAVALLCTAGSAVAGIGITRSGTKLPGPIVSAVATAGLILSSFASLASAAGRRRQPLQPSHQPPGPQKPPQPHVPD